MIRLCYLQFIAYETNHVFGSDLDVSDVVWMVNSSCYLYGGTQWPTDSPFLARVVQVTDLVVKKLLHGEPVKRLIGTPADVGVVDVRADYHTDPVPATPANRHKKNGQKVTPRVTPV